MKRTHPRKSFWYAIAIACFTLSATLLALFLNPSVTSAQDDTVILTGRVTTEAGGAPIAGVKVHIVTLRIPNNLSSVEAAVTDSAGYYTVTEAITQNITLPGTYAVYFAPGLPYAAEYSNGTVDSQEAQLFRLSASLPISGVNASLALAGTITGKVFKAENDQSYDRAVISLFDLEGDRLYSHFPTNSNGEFTAQGVAPGSYKVKAAALDSDDFHLEYFYPNQLQWQDAQAISIAPGEVITNINFSLPVGGRIAGTVYSSKGLTTTPYVNVNPLIQVYDQAGELIPAKVLPGYIGQREYVIGNIPPGRYRLYFQDQDEWHLPEYYDNQQSLQSATAITVSAREVTTDINAELAFLPRAHSIATSRALSDTILLTLTNEQSAFYTNNGGKNWHKTLTAPWAADNLLTTPYGILAPRTGPGSLLRMFLTDDFQNDLFRSGDYGDTWAVQSFADELCTSYNLPIPVASPLTPSQLFLTQFCQAEPVAIWHTFVSNDAGVTWQEIPELGYPNRAATYQIIPSPVIAGRIYARGAYVQYDEARLLQSDNGGQSWSPLTIVLTDLVLDAMDSERLYGIAPMDRSSDAPPAGKRSENGGKQWVNWAEQPCGIGVFDVEDDVLQLMADPTVSNMLYLRCKDGLYRSTNGGDHWTQISTIPGHGGDLLAPDYGNPGRILWGKVDGLWASTDHGDSWQAIMPNYALTPLIPHYLPTISTTD